MQRLSYLTEIVLSNKITRNRIVLALRDRLSKKTIKTATSCPKPPILLSSTLSSRGLFRGFDDAYRPENELHAALLDYHFNFAENGSNDEGNYRVSGS